MVSDHLLGSFATAMADDLLRDLNDMHILIVILTQAQASSKQAGQLRFCIQRAAF